MPSLVPVGGIRMSVTTTSGTCSRTTASSPGRSPATPASSRSSLAATSRDMPSRSRTWSSASTTRILPIAADRSGPAAGGGGIPPAVVPALLRGRPGPAHNGCHARARPSRSAAERRAAAGLLPVARDVPADLAGDADHRAGRRAARGRRAGRRGGRPPHGLGLRPVPDLHPGQRCLRQRAGPAPRPADLAADRADRRAARHRIGRGLRGPGRQPGGPGPGRGLVS